MVFSPRSDFGTQPNLLARLRSEKLASGSPVLDMSASNPTALGLLHDPAALASAFSSAANIRYDPEPRGLDLAREAVAEATGADPQSLYLCASTSEAYGWLFKLLCEPGETVLVPSPGYPLFDHLAGLEGVCALGYPQEYSHPGGWEIDLDSLARLLDSPGAGRIKAIVLINPNNPTGAYVQAQERETLLRLCERHDLAIVVDEVFFDFPLEPRKGRASFLGEARVPCFVLDGLSKRLCLPQAKLGWIAASGPAAAMAEAFLRLDIIADAYLSAGSPVMNALPMLFGLEKSMKARVRARMEGAMAVYRGILEYPGSPHRLLRCEGGWTALVESPRFAGEEELALQLLDQEGVFAHPGYFFDVKREPHFAFSLILDMASAREGARRYGALFDRLTLS
ncbi:MAG: pyridoxal phosphate-dependent aminotransferase [Spirochaetes bacterium]|nr:pyridoxal phosphate-dependent aminotransferase [Spirochaetota bacterium]